MAEKTKVLWAIDSLMDKPHFHMHSLKAIRFFFKDHPVEIQPVSVLLLDRLDEKSHLFTSTWQAAREIAERNVQKWLAKAPKHGIQAPEFLKPAGNSSGAAVKKLLEFAKRENAHAIVVTTHARKGLSRLFLGSFTETLILHSDVPVLCVRPEIKLAKGMKDIVFPTDFSPRSRAAFETVVSLCHVVGAKLFLFHIAEYLYPSFGYPFVVPSVSAESLREYEESILDRGESWIRWASAQGIKAKFHLSKYRGNKVDGIVRVAKKFKGAGAIAMASVTGPVGTILTGSVTRQVVRQAQNPVLVIHPEAKFIALSQMTKERLEKLGEHYEPALS